MTSQPPLEEIALAWAIRSADPAFADWDALMAWLAGDPARNLAYDRAMATVMDVRAAPAEPARVIPFVRPESPGSSLSRRQWVSAAIALSMAAGVAGVIVSRPSQDPPAWQVIETEAGRSRSLSLADGSRIDVAGGSRLRIDANRPRSARLDRGRAVFTVRHDARQPYVVVAGEHRIVDAGTTFEVVQEPGSIRVAVAEGQVIVDPEQRGGLSLDAGTVAAVRHGREPIVQRVAPATIGQWRRDRMNYDHAPLATVAADLSVALGHPITVDARAGAQRFSGTISPASLRGKPDEAGALFNVRVSAGPQGWKLHSL